MSHPSIDNKTPFAFFPAFLADEYGRPLFVPIIKATFAIEEGGRLRLADEQVPVNLTGEYWGDPETSSYKYEPECAFIKISTDVVLIGHAFVPAVGITEVIVSLIVGPLKKAVLVTGDRYWIKSLGSIIMTKPLEFESIPLIYERAFGGWDRNHPNPGKHTFEPRNPVGTGFLAKNILIEDDLRAPNLEDPANLIKSIKDKPAPAGFGFTSPHWEPRASLSGIYDATWQSQRSPCLPKNFNRRFFSAASQGLIAPGFLRGNEPVKIMNASRHNKLTFSLPGVKAPRYRVQQRCNKDVTLRTQLDTVIINTDENLLMLVWRTSMRLKNGPHDVLSVEIKKTRIECMHRKP